MKHTHGPWYIDGDTPNEIIVYASADDRMICDATMYGDEPEQDRANALLIAAAPELLAACQMLLDNPGLTASANEVLRDAIAKAKGAQP